VGGIKERVEGNKFFPVFVKNSNFQRNANKKVITTPITKLCQKISKFHQLNPKLQQKVMFALLQYSGH